MVGAIDKALAVDASDAEISAYVSRCWEGRVITLKSGALEKFRRAYASGCASGEVIKTLVDDPSGNGTKWCYVFPFSPNRESGLTWERLKADRSEYGNKILVKFVSEDEYKKSLALKILSELITV